MKELTQDRATAIANELKSIIRKYDHRNFTAHIAFLANQHVRQSTGQIKLRSPVRQLMYLVSLYHATEIGGRALYAAGTDDHKAIIRLLNEIEKGYGYEAERTKKGEMSQEEFNHMLTTKSTFLNYYLNATLSYMEQDIERIKRTFQYHKEFIFLETGLALNDYTDFFILLTNMEIGRGKRYMEDEDDPVLRSLKLGKRFNSLSESQKIHLLDLTDRKVFNMAIPIAEIYKLADPEKAKLFLAYFTLLRNENKDYLYYTDKCPYLSKPILIMDGESILMIYSKQLINAIYDFLYEVCNRPNAPGRKISERRDLYLEEKTTEVFRDFFDSGANFYRGYYVNGNEKDLLILHNRIAYVIECKAQRQRQPLRDPVRAYDRIKDDFQKSIGNGYSQAREVETLFLGQEVFKIKNKSKQTIATINPADFDEVFTIVVTQERLGQIQCDLGLLLQLPLDCPYPWAVCINDLESFLITLKRKDDHIQGFKEFLLSRELLHERVFCYDELELCAYFLFDNENFIKMCLKDGIFFSQPDVNKFFDLFYYKGFGFKDELNLSEKLKRRDLYEESVTTFHKLRPADRIMEYMQSRAERENKRG
ncbi:hypothetical protein [Pedobacter soli]|uniref:Nuclease-related domain-containing protein n=1 Tax=Pedobacter soli TaxID=390242 RepID=A0A1G6WJY7_9SPHI|nr:hypothetical protein [Pedobacter soli]SDD66148.1 hypothetical protein SAMN04488024_10744 [Pedobacter soli]